MILQKSILTPLGDLSLTEEDGAIVALDWGRGRDQADTPLLSTAADELQAYFDGDQAGFTVPLKPHGSPHLLKVLDVMRSIPYGKTMRYSDIAGAIGSSPRAVGGACGCNPIPILIPCHRVVSAAGLGGYSGDGGRETKTALLRLEGASYTG